MDWVSVKDRLPPSGEDVLFFTGKKTVSFGYYREEPPPVDNWATENSIYINDSAEQKIQTATHWMPLPLPPKEWVSFSERIPENNSYVEVKSDNLWKGEGIFQDGKFVYSFIKGACFGSPTHWKLKEILSEKEASDGKKYKSCCEIRCLLGNCETRDSGGCYCVCRLIDYIQSLEMVLKGKSVSPVIWFSDKKLQDNYYKKNKDECDRYINSCPQLLADARERLRSYEIKDTDDGNDNIPS